MKRYVSLLATLGLIIHVYSQNNIVVTATEFITQNNYARAEKYLDSLLKKNPKNVDALMMKGNVLLNYTWLHTGNTYFDLNHAESVFDTTSISQGFYTSIIPLDTSKLIEKYWLKCLQIDSTRNDIKKGLCNLYSISLRLDDLKLQLTKMKKLVTENEENAYVYAEYARNIKARGKFDEGMQVYQFIADMFPNVAGIRCDMAGEYFYNGKPKEALLYLDSALSKPQIDQTTFINAATIYSMLAYYENAYATFQKYSMQDTLMMGDFYKGLVMFANRDSRFFDQMQSFIKKASEQNYADEVHLAQKLIPFGRSEFTYDDYLALADNKAIPNYYKVLIHQRAMKQFKEVCWPFLLYGYFNCTIKNYITATQFLEEVDNCKPQSAQTEYWKLVYAYSLYQSADYNNALKCFEALFTSTDVFRQQAAKYFAAKILLISAQPQGATLMQQLRGARPSTKYAQLANTVN